MTERMRLTKTAVERLQPAAREYEVADVGIPGLYVRVYPHGAKTAVIRYKVGRRQRRYSLGRIGQAYTIAQARHDAAVRLREVRGGDDPSLDRRRRREAATVAEAAERFMTEHAEPHLRPRTVAGYRALLRNHILPAFGSMPIEDLQRVDVERLQQRVGKSAKGAANRVLALVSVICNQAAAWGYRSGSNPCKGIKRFPERPKERFLTADERARLEAVLAASERAHKGHPDYACRGSIDAVRLLSLTGCRCSEITGLTWTMVDLERGFLRLPESKTGAKVVPLSRQAVDLLRAFHQRRRPGVRWVCAGEKGGQLLNMQRSWRDIRGRAGLGDVRLHDLRHSLASDAAATGASLPVIGKMLGHKSVQTTSRYAHLVDDVVRDYMDRTGDRIEQQIRDGSDVIDLAAHREAERPAKGTGKRRSASKRRRP